jgi:preprotein translocase subunit SecF
MKTTIQNREASLWVAVIVIVAALGFWAFQSVGPAESATSGGGSQVTLEDVAGTDLTKVTLTEHAAQRIGIAIGDVTEQQVDGTSKLVVPFGSVFYDSTGQAWVYTNPEGYSYVRAALTIERIEGDLAILSDGPAVGTKIVSVGAALLFGAEFGVGSR